jgi:hypothetical protein
MNAMKKSQSYERPKLINLTSESWEIIPVGQFLPAGGNCPDGQLNASGCVGGSFVTGQAYCGCGSIAVRRTCG